MICCIDLCKSFGNQNLFKDLSFSVFPGSSWTITGRSGVGKTTLLRILCGLEEADSGQILRVKELRLSVVFQEHRLLEEASVWHNLALVLDAPKRALVDEALEHVGLTGLSRAPVSTLSGGMKRRVALLRALLHHSDVLILDEPFKELDDTTKKQAADAVSFYRQQRSLVMSCHNKEDATLLGVEQWIHLPCQ